MKGKGLLGKLSLLALFAIATQSCKKENGIDNNNVIQKPYALYAVDAKGNILKTNDGINYNTVFPGDGQNVRALITSKQNIMIVKDQTLFLSKNDGRSFDPIKLSVVTVPTNIKWPYFILDVPSFDRVLIANGIAGPGNVSFSPSNGAYFDSDTNWTTEDKPNTTESFTQTDDKVVYSYSISGSETGVSKLYYKTGKDEPTKPRSTDLPSPYNYYVAHFGNTVIATDYDGTNGSWYSTDQGKTFKQYTGLPTTKILYATYSAYDKLLIGSQNNGVYLYNNGTFVQSNSGLPANTSVYSIVGKDNLYKNNVTKKIFFIATSNGLYRSEDLAQTWIKVKDGEYKLVY